MAFNQLKKWVGTQLWSTFMTDYNENIDELNRVIAELETNSFEPWKNAALQNGWTGTLKYSKSGLGLVKFRGNLLSPSEVTARQVIATLPLGYRPLENTPFTAYDGSGGRIMLFGTISTAGSIALELQLPEDVQVAAPDKGYRLNVIFSIDN